MVGGWLWVSVIFLWRFFGTNSLALCRSGELGGEASLAWLIFVAEFLVQKLVWVTVRAVKGLF